MKRTEAEIVTLAEINLDGEALCEAALLSDWDEARFRCHLVAANAFEAGLSAVAGHGLELLELLGPAGTEPRPGYGAVLHKIATALKLDRIV